MGFLDSDSESSSGDGDAIVRKDKPHMGGVSADRAGNASGHVLRVNKKFAERFEKKKRLQDLQTAKHLDVGSGEDGGSTSSDSETEDEDAEMLTPALDLQIMKTINKIRSKDPDIYDTGKEWFGDEDEETQEGQEHSREKPMRYKDVVRQQILDAKSAEDAISSDEESDDDDVVRGKDRRRTGNALAYDAEQEQLRKGFLGSVAEQEAGSDNDDSGEEEKGELLKIRRKTLEEEALEEELLREEAEKMAVTGDGGEEDAFLKDFVANRRWRDPHAKETPSYDEILQAPHVEDSEDEQDVDKADEFESKYNFRFEEEGGGEIAMYSRNVPGSMRRKDDRRKRERENRKIRKAEERQRKEAELRRLKNLKREEIQRRLQAIQEMSGGALVEESVDGADAGAGGGKGVGADAEALLEGDFDPNKWDVLTGKAFGDGYYEAEDADDDWKPGDDPLDGLGDLGKYDDRSENYDGASAQVEGDDLRDADYAQEEGEGEDGEGGGDWEEDGQDEDGPSAAGAGGEKQRLLDELYKLDYEDIVADIPCRFKYTQVKPNDFGLTPEEILLADDKELNKFVPIKKLAPYRKDEPKLDARRRRKLREEVKDRKKAVQEELAALRARKHRWRGKKQSDKVSSPLQANAASAAVAAAPGATGEGAVTELAGGKRRRRKKGQKKKQARGSSGAVGDAHGDEHNMRGDDDAAMVARPEAEADLVPLVQPMAVPAPGAREDADTREREGQAAEGHAASDARGSASGERKKRARKRGRAGGPEDGVDAAGKETSEDASDRPVDPAGGDTKDVAGTNRAAKKSRREYDGESGGTGATRKRKKAKGGRNPKGKHQTTGEKKVAAVNGVLKSRLASYGL